MTEKFLNSDFPTRKVVRFDGGNNTRKYNQYYNIYSKQSLREVMRNYDSRLSAEAGVWICPPGSFESVVLEAEIRLENTAELLKDRDFCPSDEFKAFNDILFDAYAAAMIGG